MRGVTLQTLLRRPKAAGAVIENLLSFIDGNLCVEDAQGSPLLGTAPLRAEDLNHADLNHADVSHADVNHADVSHVDGNGFARVPVKVEDEILGFVSGSAASAELVAKTLAWAAGKEAETKQLGAEVLNAYREINLIHRFSEKVAPLLDTVSVAEAAINQACQLVKASLGVILLKNEGSGAFEAMAAWPACAFPFAIVPGEGLIGAIAERGNAEIINDVNADPRHGDKDPPLNSVICVPLRIKERVHALLVVGSAEPWTYTAGDLKLLSTLGLQTATVIENAILYEKTLEAAKVEALQKTLLEVEEQKRRAEAMLLNILPASVAKELQQDGVVQPMYFEDVTVCFTDFVGFSKSTMAMAAEDVVQELNKYFTAFDQIIERYGLEKLKTIGDSYMFVSGLPERRPANPINAVLAAMEMVETVRAMSSSDSSANWKIRVGLHTGPVIAGVVGIRKFAFDIWGETVNVASRMESCGEPNRVNISERTSARVKDFVTLEPRGRIKTKEGQDIEMYFVKGVSDSLMVDCSACPPPLFSRRYRLYFKESTPSFPAHLMAPPV